MNIVHCLVESGANMDLQNMVNSFHFSLFYHTRYIDHALVGWDYGADDGTEKKTLCNS